MPREYPEFPIVGVGAVILHEDRVLLVKRGQAPLEGEWSLPGGVLELGESLEAGLRREIFEETALVVEPLSVLEVCDHVSRDAAGRVRFHYVIIDYLCRVTGGSLACATDVAEARWASRNELSPVAPFTREVIGKGFAAADRSTDGQS